jgi:2-phospho-L-lactate guanylyltransferase
MRLDPATLWTIVPVRGLAAGKSRLAPVLNPAEREALNRELLAHTLGVVREWSGAPQRTIVVSPCARTLALARRASVTTVREGTRAVGHNHAVKLGIARATARGATHVLVMPCDLPYLGTDALRALLDASRRGKRVVLAPDKAGTGTNAVLVDAGAGFEFAFGPRSLMAHQAAATRARLTASLVQRDDLQLDLDTPDDLARWKREANNRTWPKPFKISSLHEEEG